MRKTSFQLQWKQLASLGRLSSMLTEAVGPVDRHQSGKVREGQGRDSGAEQIGLKSPLKPKFLRLHNHRVSRFGGIWLWPMISDGVSLPCLVRSIWWDRCVHSSVHSRDKCFAFCFFLIIWFLICMK